MRFLSWIPRPFKSLQKYLCIQQEWKQFKKLLWPHKYKLFFLTMLPTYPLYSPYLKLLYHNMQNRINHYTETTLNPNSSFSKILQNFLKHLLDNVFHDSSIHHQSLQFLNRIIKNQNFLNDILSLLLSCLKSQQFTQGVKSQLKTIILQEIKDPQVEKQLINTVEKVLNSPQVRFALEELIKNVFTSQEAVQTLVKLLTTSISENEVKEALGDAVNYAVREVLVDENTLNQLKVFIVFLMRKFYSDNQMKSLVDILFEKGLGIGKKKKEDPQLDRILKTDKKTHAL